ncbi:EI24 domain-containing protein [Candidatus Dojkabacteria bacterium]|uniref:EI24 domain-containing protein n=1 Tax=Candidatus Dojkabacteria bacterium TaxID=2099670 RepID=A0A955I830_9BACT|nr:EI24 domain-containing protein [Candidatus Dojkabacteria bacterium]
MGKISSSLNTLFYIRKSFQYIKANKWSWKYLLVPFILNLILSIVLWVLLFNLIQNFVLGLSFLSVIPGFLTGVISFLVLVITFLTTIFLFFLLANIIASPFNGLLTDKMLTKAGVESENKTDLVSLVVREIIRAIKFEVLKIFLVIVLFVLSLIISIVPVIGVVLAGVINFIGNTYLSLVDYFDPGLSYKGYNVSGKFKYVKNIIKESWGFFLLSGLIMYIPFINIIYIPLAVITANLVLIEKNKS